MNKFWDFSNLDNCLVNHRTSQVETLCEVLEKLDLKLNTLS